MSSSMASSRIGGLAQVEHLVHRAIESHGSPELSVPVSANGVPSEIRESPPQSLRDSAVSLQLHEAAQFAEIREGYAHTGDAGRIGVQKVQLPRRFPVFTPELPI